MTSTPATKKRVLVECAQPANFTWETTWALCKTGSACRAVRLLFRDRRLARADHRLWRHIAPERKSGDVLLDWLAAGLDPEKCVMFIQSHVPAHAELHLLLSMITPLGWLERVPTYKEQKENLKEKDLNTYGFLVTPFAIGGYSALQGGRRSGGRRSGAHVELTREIARRFNAFYAYAHPLVVETNHLTPDQKKVLNSNGTKITPDTDYIFPRVVFPEPQALLTPAPRLPGTDGRKMSKSYTMPSCLPIPSSWYGKN